VAYLQQAVSNDGVSDKWMELIELIPDARLRRESRRHALTLEWQQFNERIERKEQETYNAVVFYFSTIPVIGDSVLPFEKNRALRFLDLAVEETLGYLETAMAPQSSPEMDRLVMLWHEALAGPAVGANHANFNADGALQWLDYWTSDDERSATGLREKYLGEVSTE
jgi:hypothetical protein